MSQDMAQPLVQHKTKYISWPADRQRNKECPTQYSLHEFNKHFTKILTINSKQRNRHRHTMVGRFVTQSSDLFRFVQPRNI